MDTPSAPENCCLDCDHCRLAAGFYGSTRYRCAETGRWIDSSSVLLESCELYSGKRLKK